MGKWWLSKTNVDKCYICGSYPSVGEDGPYMYYCPNCGDNFVEEEEIVTAICEWNKEQRNGIKRIKDASDTTKFRCGDL